MGGDGRPVHPDLDPVNAQLVDVNGSIVVVQAPAYAMTAEQAMVHAAWLITMAAVANPMLTIEPALEAVQST